MIDAIAFATLILLAIGFGVNAIMETRKLNKVIDKMSRRLECLSSNDASPQMRIIPQQDFAPKKPEVPSSEKLEETWQKLQGMY